jgi:hypothetical protein
MNVAAVGSEQLLIDKYLPEYHLRTVHSILIRQPDTAIFKAVHALTMREVPVVRVLMMIRGLPGILGATTLLHTRSPSTMLQDAQRMGFIILDEDFGREMVLGLVGQFWRLKGGVCMDVRDTNAFVSFNAPDYGKAVVNFKVDAMADGGGSVLSTETRVWLTSPGALRQFRRYWRVVSFGSGVIRRAWLRAVKQRAERFG